MVTIVRPIIETDVPAYRAAVDVVARERRYLAMTEAFPLEQTTAFVKRMIDLGAPMLVVEDDGKIVGWCDVVPFERVTLKHSASLGMGLLPDYRGKGLGEPLIRQSLDEARAFGLKRVQLFVYEHNKRAAALYRKVGFVEEGRRRAATCIDGIYLDDRIMAVVFD